MKEDILSALREMGIPYDLVTHAPAHTMEECRVPAARLHAVMPANLFLRPRRHPVYYLLVCSPEARFVTASVSRQVGSPRLCFAEPDEMWQVLRCRPGSASPLELLYPEARDVTLLMDTSSRPEKNPGSRIRRPWQRTWPAIPSKAPSSL